MTKTEAAEKILKKFKRPMTYNEIIDIALSENLIKTKGLTPAQTLRVDILLENKRRSKSGRPLRFNILEKGYVTLVK